VLPVISSPVTSTLAFANPEAVPISVSACALPIKYLDSNDKEPKSG
jgi:hypothetical protein